ncbi:MAG: hypothetical protein JRH11_06785 [Deltaproteobacteria bacterium]|nr:hypothetical protein [Deltaproteobacteria bacterium]
MRSWWLNVFVVLGLSGCGLILEDIPRPDATVHVPMDAARDAAADAPPDVRAICGDRVVDGEEACDDGNEEAGDGCENDCSFSCANDSACPGADCMAGVCDPATHTCSLVPEDVDGDGYSPAGDCGGADCDDGDPAIHPGVTVDVCNFIDDDCDGETDEDDPPFACWTDRDGDGHTGLPLVRMCSITACPPGFAGRPISDCYDSSADPIAGEVNPDQTAYFPSPYVTLSGVTSFDYDCDGIGVQQYPMPPSCSAAASIRCELASGFLEPVPLCGEAGAFVTCAGSPGSCFGTASTEVQHCR